MLPIEIEIVRAEGGWMRKMRMVVGKYDIPMHSLYIHYFLPLVLAQAGQR